MRHAVGLSGDFTILLEEEHDRSDHAGHADDRVVRGQRQLHDHLHDAGSLATHAGAYKLVPHAGACSLPCESGNNNAAGAMVNL